MTRRRNALDNKHAQKYSITWGKSSSSLRSYISLL